MTFTERIKNNQAQVGADTDGFWGRKSTLAAQKHLLSMMPKNNPWPRQDDASLREFYGNPGDKLELTTLDVRALDIRYFGDVTKSIYCHRKVAESLYRVLESVRKLIDAGDAPPEILHKYAGVYNFRKMRGGSRYSLHAYGAAIDLDPANNGNKAHWPTRATMPICVMEAFSREGWTSAGAFWSRDAMHFQATRP